MPQPPEHEHEIEVFNGALKLPVGERAAYLERECVGDSALRLRVEELLKANEVSCACLEGSDAVSTGPRGIVPQSLTPAMKAGDRIGRYKLLQQIGEGGCGVVYMAEQEEPVRRRVALKVIKLGMDTKQVIARFEAERQALALMDHPNIAKVLDAGATETGRPYFVMELVKAVPITRYCDEHSLSTAARLELFIQVCQAIQHAHQKGVIHRDIKPSNILVADHDGLPVPRIIDFGIAKATSDQRLTDKTVFTAFEQFIGTPAYMSPEQAKLSGLDIDTRSDIYSLGVLLYELLTSKTPFESRRLLEAGLDEIRRIIREEEPVRPSTRLHTLDAAEQTTVAKHRQSDPPKLVHLIRGDLDWIVMKALEKDRARRYETANGLATDVQRHLNNEPVGARPQSQLYRFERLVRRNKLVCGAISAVAVALVVGLTVSFWQFVQKKSAYQRLVTAEAEQRRLLAEAQKAQASEAQARSLAEQRLYSLLMDQARTTRTARGVGYRDRVFELIRQANSLNVPNKDLGALRGEAIACLGDFAGLAPSMFTNFPAPILLTRVDPRGRCAAFALLNNSIAVRALPSGKDLGSLGTGLSAHSLCFDATGDQLVSVQWQNSVDPLTNAQVLVCRRASDGQWQESQKLVLPGAYACLSCSKGVFVATGSNDTSEASLVDLNSRATVLRYDHPVRWLWAETLALSSDGRFFATFSGEPETNELAIDVWDLETKQRIKRLSRAGADLSSLNFSPDGRILASLSRLGATLFPLDGSNAVSEIKGYFGFPTSPALAPGRNVIALPIYEEKQEKRVRLYDWVKREDVATLEEPETPQEVGFTQDGSMMIVNGRNYAQCYVFGVEGEAMRLSGHNNSATEVAFSPDGTHLASVSWDRTAKLWDASTGRIEWEKELPGAAHTIAYSSDGKWLATAGDGSSSVWVWDARAGEKVLELPGEPGYIFVRIVRFSSDGRFLASASEKPYWAASHAVLRVWELESAKGEGPGPSLHARFVKSYPRSTVSSSLWALVFAPGSSRLAFMEQSGVSNEVQELGVWDLSRAGAPNLLANGLGGIGKQMASWSADGDRLVYLDSDRDLVTVDARNGEQLSSFPTLPPDGPQDWQQLVSLCVSPDGALVALSSPSSRSVDIWDSNTGSFLYELPEENGAVRSLSWSPKSDRLAVSRSTGEITIWNLADVDRILATLGLRPERIRSSASAKPRNLEAKMRLQIQLGRDVGQRGDLERGEKMIRDALVKERELPGIGTQEIATSLSSLAELAHKQDRLADAETNYTEALALLRKEGPSPFMANLLQNLADVQANQGRLEQAEASQRERLAFDVERTHGENSTVTDSLARLIRLLLREHKAVEVTALFRAEVERAQKRDPVVPQEDSDSLGKIIDLLLSENEGAQAQHLINDVLGPALQAQPQNRWLLRDRADFFARTAQWKAAADDLAKSLEADPSNHETWYPLLPLLAASGDVAAYDSYRQRMLEHFSASDDPVIAERTTKACLLLAPTPIPLVASVKLADVAAKASSTHGYGAYFELAKGLAEYRQGHFQVAEDWLKKSLSRPSPDRNLVTPALLFLAMAHHQAGRPDLARTELSEAAGLAQLDWPGSGPGDLGAECNDWLIANILLREAKQLIEGAATTRASNPLVISASVRDANSLLYQAEAVARKGRWKEAAQAMYQAGQMVPVSDWFYHKLAPLLVADEDLEGYEKVRHEMVEQFQTTQIPEVAERMAKDCLILPATGSNLEMACQLADQAVALSQPGVKLPFNEFAKGLAEYRRGNYEAAVEWMRKALDASDVSFRDAQAYLVLALAQHQLSHVGEAREALAYGLEIIDTQAPKLKSGDLGDSWNDWIIARSLANEARTLINGGTTRAESTNP